MDGTVRCLALLLVVLHLTIPVSCFFDPLGIKKTLSCDLEPKRCSRVFQSINDDLVKTVKTANVDANMAQISEWIYDIDKRSKLEGLPDALEAKLTALHLIDDLKHIEGRGVCKPSTATTLRNNDLALGGALSRPGADKALKSRLAKILKHFTNKFLENCDYKLRLKDFNQEHLEGIKRVIGELIGTWAQKELDIYNLFGPRVKDIITYVHDEPIAASSIAERGMKSLDDKKYAVIVYSYLIDEMSKDYQKAASEATLDDESFVAAMLREHLFGPCESYIERLESVFSNKWALAQSKRRNKDETRLSGLYEHLAYFHGCKKVLLKKREIIKTIAGID